jgi:hypothetical protein
VKRFYQTVSRFQVQGEFQVKFGCRKPSSRTAINKSVTKFESSGTMVNNEKSVVFKMKRVRMPENVCVQQALTHCRTTFFITLMQENNQYAGLFKICETVSIQNLNAAIPGECSKDKI